MNAEFIQAVNHAMIYEVGGFWNPSDPDVIAGKISTKEQRRKVGYTNTPGDRGGETKFGVAKNANPSLNVAALTLEQAYQVYYNHYWVAGKCDLFPFPLSLVHFDACVNHGIGRAAKLLQAAVGVNADGVLGPVTFEAVNASFKQDVIDNLFVARSNFYNAIVARDASQQKFLKGWMNRVTDVTNFAKSLC